MAATGEVALLRADATLLGGVDPWLRAVGSAEAHGVAAFPHFWAEVHRHLMAGCTRRGLVEIGVPGGGEFGLDASSPASRCRSTARSSRRQGRGSGSSWTGTRSRPRPDRRGSARASAT